ncbi:MAG: NAD(P)H-binding protein [Streptomyces sp.]|nr:NAD(P)H-binding protein [Streptomyces sp.]
MAVLGATGRVGRLVVEQALQRGHEVVVLVRRPETRPVSGQPTVEIRRADVTAPAAFPDLTDVDVVVSALGIGKGRTERTRPLSKRRAGIRPGGAGASDLVPSVTPTNTIQSHSPAVLNRW